MKPGKAIVVGGSSGLGAEIVRQLATQGWLVAAVARDQERLGNVRSAFPDRIRGYCHDVLDTVQVPELFETICRDLDGLDLIVYSAGVMPVVEPTEFDFRKDESMIAVNFTGAVAWLNPAAERFQGTGSGTIVGIGSVAGDRGRQGQPVYNATKAALATYLESLRNRLSKQGVKVVTIKPGPIATPMTAHLDASKMMPVDVAAEKAIRAMGSSGEKYLKASHRVIFAVIRHIPSWIFRRLKL